MAAISVGDVSAPVYGRSSNKPLQAVAMVCAGLDLPPDQLALVAPATRASSATSRACAASSATFWLSEHHLQNTADLPLDLAAQIAYVRGGGKQSALTQNCSGKHAGMLATCVVNGWPTDGYLDEPSTRCRWPSPRRWGSSPASGVAHVGVDGCGAPAARA